MASFNAAAAQGINVLLVDHETESLFNTAKLLEMCSYQVKVVDLASAAISILASGKEKFDIVMANMNSPDLLGFQLLHQSANMDLLVIMMTGDDNMCMAKRALENGAFLCIKKPAPIEILSCLWQYALKEKVRVVRENKKLPTTSCYGADIRGISFFNDNFSNIPKSVFGVGNSNNVAMINNNNNKRKAMSKLKEDNQEYRYDSENYLLANMSRVKRKVCTEWTPDLHAKFVDAVKELGEGKCFPKEILEIMDTPGLTRMQVASHLQKCRNDNWRALYGRNGPPESYIDANGNIGYKQRRFGAMPQLVKLETEEWGDPANHPGILHSGGNGTLVGDYPRLVDEQLPLPGTFDVPYGLRHPYPDELFNFNTDVDGLINNFLGMPPPPEGGIGSVPAYDHHYYGQILP